MSDPNVERKKSYRWASASKVSYDGADWDSSDEEAKFDPSSPVDSNRHRGMLPNLPKLDYTNELNETSISDQDYDEKVVSEETKTEKSDTRFEQPVSQENLISPQIVMTPEINEYSLHDIGSTTTSHHNDSNLSIRKNSPSRDINEDLDNLMKQISKEMTPKMPTSNGTFGTDNATSDSINDQYLSARASQSPFLSTENLVDRASSQSGSIIGNNHSIGENEQDSQSIDDIHVARSGYFKDYLQSNKKVHDDEEGSQVGDETRGSGVNEENDNEDNLSFTNSIIYSDDNNDAESDELRTNIENNFGDNGLPPAEKDNVTCQDESDGDFKFHNKQTRQSIIESSDDNEDGDESDDGIIYTNQNNLSLASDKTVEDETHDTEKIDKNVPKSRNDDYDFGSSESEVENDEDDESGLKVSKSGYFSKMINQPGQVFSRNEHEDEERPEIHYYKAEDSDLHGSDDDGDSLSIPETINDEVGESKPNLHENETNKSTPDKTGPLQHSDEEIEEEEEEEEEEDRFSISKSINSQTNSTTQFQDDEKRTSSTSIPEGNESDKQLDSDDDNDDVKTAASWQPDTEASRSGFVQETAKKLTPPPGFVFDENGKLVDLTPSSMKPRVVSTYSEIESGWNVFPTNRDINDDNDDNADLETVHDTKTLYDNSTIYNVPGLLTNNQNLPPLPGKIDTTAVKNSNTDTDSASTYHTPLGGVTPISGQSGKTMPTSQYSLNITAPNSRDISKINLNNAMPELNIAKLISSKKTDNIKLQQLNEYYDDLTSYDTGLQTWVRYSLNMPRDEKDGILDYKQSKIVRDAYENAEDMSKRHTVSNTVASVNHNVNHLKKKVLQHTIKPKTLFSSIGKGVKL